MSLVLPLCCHERMVALLVELPDMIGKRALDLGCKGLAAASSDPNAHKGDSRLARCIGMVELP